MKGANNFTLAGMKKFFASDAAGGVVLMISAVLAMIAANTGLSGPYQYFVTRAQFTINDFLMAFFFLYAGLEIKRELVSGALSSKEKALLPLIAAACGMAVPALIYLFFAPDQSHGWAIPSATDIAFALGVLGLAGKRVPASLKVLLLAIAVIDDLGAILVIVFFYSNGISLPALGLAVLATAGLIYLNRRGFHMLAPYIVLAMLLWWALLSAGIHPTIGGVILGFCLPMSRVKEIQYKIAPWITFGVMPLFGFANAGVSLTGMHMSSLLHPVTVGIALGLFVGKPVGICLSIYMCVKTGLCRMADDLTYAHILALGWMCGIGFTMALFVGDLAFSDPALDVYVRMGVIGGSILSGLLGYTVVSYSSLFSKGLSK